MSLPMKVLFIYTGIMSVISVVVCCHDKLMSKTRLVSLRTPETKLLILSALGGSAAMFLCMLVIRHKTKHKRFMIGIPLIILLHVLLLAAGAVAAVKL